MTCLWHPMTMTPLQQNLVIGDQLGFLVIRSCLFKEKPLKGNYEEQQPSPQRGRLEWLLGGGGWSVWCFVNSRQSVVLEYYYSTRWWQEKLEQWVVLSCYSFTFPGEHHHSPLYSSHCRARQHWRLLLVEIGSHTGLRLLGPQLWRIIHSSLEQFIGRWWYAAFR